MNATALSAGNSLVNPTKDDIFANEESILHALSFVRHSAVPIMKKDALRDLFLAYAGTADQKEQLEIKAKILEELKSQPELSSLLPKEKPKVSGALGMSRPVPTFSAPATPTPAIPKTEIVPPPIEPVAQPIPPPPPVEPVPKPITPPAPEPVAPVSTPPTQTPNAKARIDAIKRDINGRIGNPVNLIETNEQIGREYMNALLDAMKRSSRGDNDLTRLESAYQAALSVIKTEPAPAAPPVTETVIEKAAPPPPPPPPPVTETVVEKAVPPPPPPPPIVNEPIAIPPEPEVAAPTAPTPQVPPPIMKESPRVGLYHRPIDETLAEEIPTKKIVEAKPVEVKKAPSVIPPSMEESEMKLPSAEEKLPSIPPTKSVAKIKVESAEAPKPTPPPIEQVDKPIPPPPPPEPKPVTPPPPPPQKPETAKPAAKPIEETKLRPLNETSSALPEQISKLKSAAEAREEAAKKPITDLKAPEIDQGLRLLLAEWTLFKNSGFFRRKPSGIDSPLYKQLAPLPMASVIAGRFEGVTPEIKHTLADYMTGWRYEQGVIHDMGETFENYLRRVVKEILEKQRMTKNIPENNEAKK